MTTDYNHMKDYNQPVYNCIFMGAIPVIQLLGLCRCGQLYMTRYLMEEKTSFTAFIPMSVIIPGFSTTSAKPYFTRSALIILPKYRKTPVQQKFSLASGCSLVNENWDWLAENIWTRTGGMKTLKKWDASEGQKFTHQKPLFVILLIVLLNFPMLALH